MSWRAGRSWATGATTSPALLPTSPYSALQFARTVRGAPPRLVWVWRLISRRQTPQSSPTTAPDVSLACFPATSGNETNERDSTPSPATESTVKVRYLALLTHPMTTFASSFPKRTVSLPSAYEQAVGRRILSLTLTVTRGAALASRFWPERFSTSAVHRARTSISSFAREFSMAARGWDTAGLTVYAAWSGAVRRGDSAT